MGTAGGVIPLPPAAAQSAVLLQIRPRAGDTLHLRMDQSVEMAGTKRNGEIDQTSVDSHALVVLTRIAIEATDLEGATVTAVTDSVRLSGSGRKDIAPFLAWARAMQGQRFRFRVGLDGSTSVHENTYAPPQVGTFLSQLPATLPRDVIAPGATWVRTMEIPLSPATDAKGSASMTATFRFDSLSRGGDLAWLSMKGRLSRTSERQRGSTSPTVEMNGTVSGTVLVDRRRGWITDARTLINVRSLVYAKAGGTPVRVRMKITQWMRAQ